MGLFIAGLDVVMAAVYAVGVITGYCLGIAMLAAECQSGVDAAALKSGTGLKPRGEKYRNNGGPRPRI